MKRLLAMGVVIAALVALPTASAGAAANPSGTGQPGQTCLSSTAPSEPGHASSAPGSAFNEPSATSTGGIAGSMYAGSGHAATVSGNPNAQSNLVAVSQYDVACYQVSQH